MLRRIRIRAESANFCPYTRHFFGRFNELRPFFWRGALQERLSPAHILSGLVRFPQGVFCLSIRRGFLTSSEATSTIKLVLLERWPAWLFAKDCLHSWWILRRHCSWIYVSRFFPPDKVEGRTFRKGLYDHGPYVHKAVAQPTCLSGHLPSNSFLVMGSHFSDPAPWDIRPGCID